MHSALLLVAVAQSLTFTQAVEKAAKLIDSSKSATVSVSVTTVLDGAKTQSTLGIAYLRPNTIRINIREPEQGEFDATNRTYFIGVGRAVGVDHRANEFLTRKPPTSGDLGEKSELIVGNLGEPFSCAISGLGLRSMMWRFAKMGAWKSITTASGTQFSSENKQQKAKLSVGFQRDGRLSKVDLLQKGNRSLWTYNYGPGIVPVLRIPSDARRVTQFTARPKPPKFQDNGSRQTLDASIKAYGKLSKYVLDVTGTEAYRLWVSNRKIRFESDNVKWVYDGGQSAIVDVAGKRYISGKASSGDFIDALGKLRSPAPPQARNALLKNNPIVALLTGDFKVRSAGSVHLRDKDIVIVEIESRFWAGLLDVETKTHLVSKLTIENRDQMGRVVSRSSTSLNYRNINVPIADAAFKMTMPTGYKRISISAFNKAKS